MVSIYSSSTHHTRVDGTIQPYRYFNNHDDKVALGPREHSLSVSVMVGFNKKTFKPQLDAIKDKYYEMFRNKSGKETRV
jgi:hypothetical protein